MKNQPDIYNMAGYALACHLALDYNECVLVINNMIEMILKERVKVTKQELYSLLNYKAHVLIEDEQWEQLELMLEEQSEKFLNKVFYHQFMMKSCFEQKKVEKGMKSLDFLLQLLPQNQEYIALYLQY